MIRIDLIKLLNLKRKLSIILSIIILILNCTKIGRLENPSAKEGYLDLTLWDFKINPTVKLDGYWEFYHNQLVNIQSFKSSNQPILSGYIPVPKKWGDTIINDKKISGIGYATYRLKFRLNYSGEMSLKVKTIGTSYKMFLNGKLISERGVVGTKEEDFIPDWKPEVIDLGELSLEENILEVQVANYIVSSGGIWDSILLGCKNDIILLREINLSRDTFVSGGLLIIGIYHVFIFYFRRFDKTNFMFGLFCLIMSFRSLLVEEIILRKIFPELPWKIIANLEYYTFFFTVPVSLSYYRSCFPQEFNQKIYLFFKIISIFVCTVSILTPISIYTVFLRPMQLLTALAVIYVVFVTLKTIINKREGAIIFSLGSIVFTIFIFNDFLHNLKIINTGNYSTAGLFIFIFSQSFLLSEKISKAMQKEEELTITLERKVAQRTEELIKEKDSLIKANMEIEKLSLSRKRLSEIGEMASSIVHDIKNPISTIKSFADLAKSNSISDSQREEYLNYIIREISTINDLAYEILDFAKGSIQIYKEKEKPSVFIKEIYEYLKLEFDHAGIELKLIIEDDSEVELDKDRMRRVIINLSKNAMEEMGDGIKKYFFEIKIYRHNKLFMMSFKDNGKGLREEVKNKIFEAFSSKGKEYGTGLGLYICKQIIEAHNGRIYFDSIPNQGTTFFVELP